MVHSVHFILGLETALISQLSINRAVNNLEYQTENYGQLTSMSSVPLAGHLSYRIFTPISNVRTLLKQLLNWREINIVKVSSVLIAPT